MAMENPPFIDEFHISALVGGLEYECYFSHHVGNVIIPTDELNPSFFRGVGQPPTRLSTLIGKKKYTLW